MQAKFWEYAPARGWRAGAWALIGAWVLSSCGGDIEPASGESSSKAAGFDRRARAMNVVPTSMTIPADATQKGMFGRLANWPVIAVHAVLMPDGRVMSYGTKPDGQQTGFFNYDLWDSTQPVDSGHTTLANGTATDIFCSSQVLLPDAASTRVFIAGGDNWTGSATTNTGNNNSNLLSVADSSLTRGVNMNRARWYSSSTVLLNGEVLVQGGSGGTDRPEIRGRDGTFRLLHNADTSGLDFMYPRNFVAPDGRVFGYDSNGRMYYLDTGSGALTMAGQFAGAYRGSDASAAMFRPGRILQFGGASNGAAVIDITGGAPVVTPTHSMASQRRLATATVLADGRVLATGGSPVWNDINNAALSAEIWNPQTGQWTVGATGAVARLYHSNALLLPDATVLVAGGGAPGPLNNLNAEIYYPPYLFTADGHEAPRPAIVATPDYLQVGKTVTVDVDSTSTISRVTLVKTGSTTHGWNMEQRFVELPFRAEGNRLRVQAPTRAADAPPGYYQLFVFDANGVPSVAKLLFMGVASNPNPAVVPVLATPSHQTSTIGTSVDLALQASDPNGDTLSYSAAGLPPGLSIDVATGRITGQPTQVGSYDVVLGVSDGYNAASTTFTWQVNGDVLLQLSPVVPAGPVQSGADASFNASASGNGVQYQWNFGDGSPSTEWSDGGGASHTYTRAGTYFATVTVRDAYGTRQSQSFLQAVYLPPTALPPTSSGPVLTEAQTGVNTRVWVVNPDNDSVSVFDLAGRTKLAEVHVGAAPRTLARAADGRIWVANLRGASLSVIDPNSFTVTATIALPRGSQPYAVAMSPSGTQAFVTLEASGQLLRFDTANRGQTGALAVGPHARHVAVSGDGSKVYVSRFVTPPLPGEGTATVSPTAATGGQLLVIDAAAMSLQRTIVLQHSDKVDAETQGRGIPNYLGALAISPDGTQGFVPSKQDNVKRGARRDGLPLNFQNTIRAISSRVDLAAQAEDLNGRVDHDNAGLASAAVFDPRGVYLFVALETSREVALLDAHTRSQLLRVDVGRAPQGLALSPDGLSLLVSNFMDRTVSIIDLKPLVERGQLNLPVAATLSTVAVDKLGAQVLQGKRLFYDARDIRLSRDRYVSCAACHHDGAADGRVWDLSDGGEGLRNTINLRGRTAMGQGPLHWSANFDELQDFEGQIRRLHGGTGLMSDAAYFAGTRSQPLGDAKAGQSADLDALAAYVASLSTFDPSPARPEPGALSSAASAGKAVFQAHNCAACHAGQSFSRSGSLGPVDVGTLKPTSGQRLGGALTGLDVPTLRDVWATAPYLHDGSAATLDAAVAAHRGVVMSGNDMSNLVAYLREIGGDEVSAPTGPSGGGSGLSGQYFNNISLSGGYTVLRNEAVDFDWGGGAPAAGIPADYFSVRWTGKLIAPTSGLYTLRTSSDDGVRLWVNGALVIDNWTDHAPTTNTSAAIALTAGAPADIRLEYYERGGGAVMRLHWLPPGATTFAAIPAAQLTPSIVGGTGLLGSYFNNRSLSGTPALTRTEAVDFNWATGSPGTGVGSDNFSVRWTGTIEPTVSGVYTFQTVSDDGVRLSVNGTTLISNWTDHGSTTNTSGGISLTAGRRYTVTLEYYENGGYSEMRWRWRVPGSSSHVAVPANRLYTN
ncbi:MAG TPA: PA14 domain-containing protein [Ideonella sp.]|uniref:PA14 domain-containing protein n=1 Tax=Ideonella sp. TaxID=1929293 RepID=UPI002E3774F9|nr:PA14 domain-containing protein [Ideonella sp.]HEX5685644.1 PA14 domain-containing protein [Ideonella sp.]